MDRPELEKLLKIIKEGDTLVVTKLDRFARRVSQASELITTLIEEGIPKGYGKKQIEHALMLLKNNSCKQVEAITGISKSTLIRAKKAEFSYV